MIDLPQYFYVLIDYPTLIIVPMVFFAALALWGRSRSAWAATIAWNIYLIYELGMKAGEFCSGLACLKRTPLYLGYPVLAIVSLVSLVQVYVHVRDKRNRQRISSAASWRNSGAGALAVEPRATLQTRPTEGPPA